MEGFFSFDPRIPDWLKVTFAAGTLAAWLAFFTMYGRARSQASVQGAEEAAG